MSPTARRTTVSIILSVLIVAAGIGTFRVLTALRAPLTIVEPDRRPLAVNAVRLEPVTLVLPIEGFGTARADCLAALSARVAGRVVAVAPGLRDGARVAAGDVLVRIDEREHLAQLRRAEARVAAAASALAQLDVEEQNTRRLLATATTELELAEAEYVRVLDLFERGQSNPRELDNARAELQRARRTLDTLDGQLALLPHRRTQQQAACAQEQAAVDLARLSVEWCEIRAPFAGCVERVDVEIGEEVSPGRVLLAVLDPALIEVPIALPAADRPRVRPNAAVELWLENRPDARWSGAVARIAPSVDAGERTFAIFVEVVNGASTDGPDGPPLMPGMFVRARIEGPTVRDALLVPRGAVRHDRVFICDEGRAAQRDVQVRHRLLDHVAIEGVPAGTIVITSNLDALVDGTPVEPVLRRDLPDLGHTESPGSTRAARSGS